MSRITSFFGNDDNRSENEYTSNPELKAIIKRMDKLEFTCHALWLMLNKKGFTNEEFDQATAEAFELQKRKDFNLKGIRCPACGQNAQLSESYRIKCIYCGEEAVMHPYEIYNMLPEIDENAVAPESIDLASDKFLTEENLQPEPYDINKDLNFGDL